MFDAWVVVKKSSKVLDALRQAYDWPQTVCEGREGLFLIFSKRERLVKKQKRGYKADSSRLISDSGNEKGEWEGVAIVW